MGKEPEKTDKNDILKKTTATNLWLRIFVGGFLVYLAYTIGIELGDASGKDIWILGGATVVFAVFGIAVTVWSLYRLIKKDYYDPLFDAVADEESDEGVDENNNSQ
nr:hypothetical protein [Lachnospiraceae bacterium]